LAKLLAKKRQLGVGNAPEPARPPLELPQGAIRDAILEVLAAAPGALRAKDIQSRAEQRLGIPVSYDTVGSYLSVACRAATPSVVRVSYGRYQLVR
jgi:hypothetical protein